MENKDEKKKTWRTWFQSSQRKMEDELYTLETERQKLVNERLKMLEEIRELEQKESILQAQLTEKKNYLRNISS